MSRIYHDFIEALPEIGRDLKEMGVSIHPKTYQDKVVADNPNFKCYEVTNYMYTVTSPRLEDLEPTQPWADAEFVERVTNIPENPGDAWNLRKDVWEQFLQEDGTFAYTYGERLASFDQIDQVVRRLKADPDSRQCMMGIWWPTDLQNMGGISRVPCTLGYYFQVRQGMLHMTYLQRSADFYTHFVNDIYLAFKMQSYIADQVGVPVGQYTHWLGSLHVFQKDVAEVF